MAREDSSEVSEGYGRTAPAPASDVADRDPRTVVDAHVDLLADAPHIDETPPALNEAVGELLTLLGNAHALAILYHLCCMGRPMRFTELESAVGASPKVLSARLSELAAAGLISRRSYDEIPPRVEYEPTAKAVELEAAFQFLYAWANRHGSVDGA